MDEQTLQSIQNADFSYLNLSEEERKQAIQNLDEVAYEKEQKWQKAISSPMKTQQEMYVEDLQNNILNVSPDKWRTNEQEILMSDKDYRQKKFKEALHDFTYLDSAEHHLVDMINSIGNEDNKIIFNIDQARQYAKEKGVDWNSHEKETITKYELDTVINRELLRRELQQEISEYAQYKDYTKLDTLSRMCSAISGGVGAIELAATIGLGWLTGAGMAAGLTRIGNTVWKAGSIARGVHLAQKMELAQKTINTYETVLKEINTINKVKQADKIAKMQRGYITAQKEIIDTAQKAIKSDNLLAKTGYDTYRFMKTGIPGQASIPGTRGSLITTGIPFAIDSMVTDLPREFIQKRYSDIFDTGEYTNKDMLRDLMIAGGIGYVLPWGGAALKAGGTLIGKGIGKGVGAAWDITQHVTNKINGQIEEKKAQAILKGKQAEVDALELQKQEAAKILQDIKIGVENNNQLAPENIAIIQSMQDMNMTDDEVIDYLVSHIDTFTTGELGNTYIPRTQWMSTEPGIYDIANRVEKQGGTIDDVWNEIKNSGAKIEVSGSWRNGKAGEGNFLEEFVYRIRDLYFDSKAKFKNEKGYLGNRSAMGISNNDADYFLKNLYVAHLLPETKIGKIAKQNLMEYHNHLQDLSTQIKKITNRYNEVVNINKAKDFDGAARLWVTATDSEYTKTKFSALSIEQQQKVYPLMNGQHGSLTEAIREVIFEMLPKEIKEQYRSGKQFIQNYQMQSSLAGHGNQATYLEFEKISQFIKEIDETISSIASEDDSLFIKRNSKYYENTGVTAEFEDLTTLPRGKSRQTGEAKATRSARIEYMGELIDDIIKNNENLLNAEDVYQKTIPDISDILEPNSTKEIYNVTEAERWARESVSDVSVSKVIKSDNAKVERFNTERIKLDTVMQNEKLMGVINTLINGMLKTDTAKKTIGAYSFVKFQQRMTKLDEVLKENFTPVRNVIIEKMKTSQVFNEILEKPNYGKISETNAIWKIPKYRNEFKKLLKESLDETINDSGKYTELFGDKFEQLMDNALDAFDDYIRNNMDEGLKNIATPHGYNAETNTKEEIAREIFAQTQREQIIDNILNPFYEQLSYEAMDLQAANYKALSNLIDTVEQFTINPGQIDEIILGKITMSPIISQGSSLSIEARAKIDSERIQFFAALDRNDNTAIKDGIIPQAIVQNKEFEPLRNYAMNPENLPAIQEAIFERLRFINGEMTDEESKLYNRQSNTRAARVAHEYLNIAAGLKQMLFNVGSNKNKIVQLLDPTKIKDMRYYLSKNNIDGKYARGIRRYAVSDNAQFKGIAKSLNKLAHPQSQTQEGLADYNMMLDCFEKLDLDKQFKNNKGYSLNEVRDALVEEGGLEDLIEKQVQERTKNLKDKNAALIQGEREKVIADIEHACNDIVTGFYGTPGIDIGFINRLRGDIKHVQNPMSTSFRARYVEDIEPKFFYKNPEYEKQDIKTLGFDNLQSMFESNFGTAKKAYAVLDSFGDEPVQYTTMLKELAREYAEKIAPQAHGLENANKLMDKLGANWEKAVDFNLHNVCGTYTVPANNFQKWAQIVIRLLSSPMLMKAGFRSASDYNYQMQSLITMGLASEGDLQARYRVSSQMLRYFSRDKDLAKQIFMTETIRTDTLYNILYNTSIGSGDILERHTGRLNQFAPKLMKAEKFAKWYSDTLLNKFAWIGPSTDYNRTNAALTTMKAIGGYSSVKYGAMPERLQQTLTRFGISEYEWDNILSKYVVTNAKNYIHEMSGKTVTSDMIDYKMFFPELVDKISDKEITRLMTEQKMPITDMAKAQYRQYLKDKASLLINTSADEMTSIPSSRIQGAMALHNLPNTSANFLLNTVLQFQSFGVAVNYYQWGRRLASYQTADSAFNHLLYTFSGHPASYLTMAQFIAESALVEFFLGEIIREVNGTNRRLINDRGEFQTDALVDKTIEAIGGPLGMGNMLTQTILSYIMNAKGQGGGLAIPAFPSVSAALQKVTRVTDALTKESTKESRGKALAGALGENVADFVGLPNQPFAHAAWGLIIGDSFKEWQYGDRAKAVKTQRLHRGYTPSWTRHIAEETGILMPEETSLYSRFAE